MGSDVIRLQGALAGLRKQSEVRNLCLYATSRQVVGTTQPLIKNVMVVIFQLSG
jgi:hypothetical protein